jgi:CBS-domain-containing membrane protein
MGVVAAVASLVGGCWRARHECTLYYVGMAVARGIAFIFALITRHPPAGRTSDRQHYP